MMDQSQMLTVVGNAQGDTNISINEISNVTVMISCAESEALSNKLQIAVGNGQSPALTRDEDFQLVNDIVGALQRSRCGLLNMLARKELQTAERCYVESAGDGDNDKEVAKQEILSAEIGEPVK